ncbi:2OG-Fe(II) oxygenase family [Chlorella sorokiniana]|uniref:2OG-Fe(II) oxygenase family n=1 Tax=Chlorella sorokiniana TaxID=3076 RepID=A0A2P6TG97_CHLSO|nr:2OG-Fe(II) oxygenase family [Chlorella sorokiniana]|eukprot:PRW33139.1 2OG-Fe(II) oxygenase family [Chlorella sorokiniana]
MPAAEQLATFTLKRGANGTFQKLQRVPCPQLQAWLEREQGLPAKQAAEAAWQLALAFQSEQAALAGLPAAFAFCRSQQLSGPEAAAVLCSVAKLRRENVAEFAANTQPVWLLLDSCFAAYVEERRQQRKRLPEHLTLGSMLRSNLPAAVALVMQPGHVQRWLDTVGTQLSAADVGAMVAKQPEIVCSSPHKAVAAVAWVSTTFPEVPLSKILRGAPWLLQTEVATLQRKLLNMAAAVGVTEAQAKKLVLKMPALLTSSKDDTVQGAVAWLRQFFPSTDELLTLLLRGPTLLGASTDKLQQPKLLFLSEVVGVSRVELIELCSNYLKYSLPTMTASYVLLRERAPQQLVYEDGSVSLLFTQGRAEDLAGFCGMTVEQVRWHLREWPRCGEGRPLLDGLRQGSVAGWAPYLQQLDEQARLRQQASGQLGSSGTAAGGKRRRRRQQPQPDPANPSVVEPLATWRPPCVDIGALAAAPAGAERLAAAIAAAPEGVLLLANALPAPFEAIGQLFGRVTPQTGARANAAYQAGTSRLVWKDAHGEGRGGPHVDYKRVIDLSPHRVEDLTRRPMGPCWGLLLGAALTKATGYPFTEREAKYAYRMVDYGARALQADVAAPPRCSAHRDFGPATLIWASGEGLEVKVDGTWRRLARPAPGTAVLLFGICTAWRSNERIPAAEHRVADTPAATASQRRLSAVLFVGLCDDALLAPALTSCSEQPLYRTVRVGDVGPTVRRKWSWREGSVTAEEWRRHNSPTG